MDENYLDDVYFIGDSRTVGLVRAGMPEDHLFAETGMCHEDALTKRVVILDDTAYLTIPDALQIVAPKIAVVNFEMCIRDRDRSSRTHKTAPKFQKISRRIHKNWNHQTAQKHREHLKQERERSSLQ